MIDLFIRFILPAAYELLPPAMESQAATGLMLAIGLQESRFEHRRQIKGPAKSAFQFERDGGVRGVMEHPSTAAIIRDVFTKLRYPTDLSVSKAYDAIEHNDILASCFARCLLWTDARPLPFVHEPQVGWQIYTSVWKPGRPHPDTWSANYAAAWARTIVPVPGDRRA